MHLGGTAKSQEQIDRAGAIAASVEGVASVDNRIHLAGASGTMERHERALRLAEALAKLPDAQRDAVVLRHFQGLSLAEIADELDCTTAAVTGLLQRGLKNLRNSLAEGSES